MTDLITGGYAHFANGSDNIYAKIKGYKFDWKIKPEIKHYSGPTHLGYSLLKRYLVVQLIGIILSNHSDFATFISNIISWQEDSSKITFGIKRDATNYDQLDGSSNTYTMMIARDGFKGGQRLSRGTQDGPYEIELLILEEAG